MTIKLSSLIKGQLPEFINNQYSTFASFLEKYYEGLETHGQPLDILSNLTSYYDINYYQSNLLERGSTLTQSVGLNDTTFELENAEGFPDEYGYFKIDNEICFYTEKVGNTLTGVLRGVSGTTRLGDLYKASTYTTTEAENHSAGATVQNISNLFLFAIVKSFESQYLSSIPKNYLTDDIDKRTLIKNITDFYKSKGSEKSIKFIFNSLISSGPEENATIRRPVERTLKASESDWISNYEIYVSIISGDPKKLVNQKIEQLNPYASAIVDSIVQQEDNIVKLVVDKQALNSEFEIYGFTELVNPISTTASNGSVIDVVSTKGWNNSNEYLYIGNEEIEIKDRNINQFVIKTRTGSTAYAAGTKLYDRPPLSVNGVKFQVTGSVYSLKPKNKIPYSAPGEPIIEYDSAVSSSNVIVFDKELGDYRWFDNQNTQRPSVPLNAAIQQNLNNVNADVSAIFEDENYFYICSSGYPSFDILQATDPSGLENNKYLKLLRKNPISNTEIYKVGREDVGILLDGTLAYSKTSNSFVNYGKIEKVNVISKGSGYKAPPIVLVNNSPVKAKAIVSGEVVSDIEILTDQTYRRTPNVVITAGRNAKLNALVTSGRITDIVITDPGEYYTAPPTILITDTLGRGRFAKYNAVISSQGKIIGVEKIDEGRNYTQGNVKIDILPAGSGAKATFEIKKWYKNRYTQFSSIDDNSGVVIEKKFPLFKNLGKTYAVIANPRKLRFAVQDNINASLNETPNGHSKIIGYAYDGNPIYGPYGYEDSTDPLSPVVRLLSGYSENVDRPNGPPLAQYPIGTFDEDYTWSPNVDTGKRYLDNNNGRFCVTPEYPEGTYAYFLTIDVSGNPVYPYILGENYYSIPVDSNYNSPITQDQVPRSAKLLNFSRYLENGQGFSAQVTDVQQGFVNGFILDDITREHNPGNEVITLDPIGSGSGLEASVGTVSGTNVDYLRAKRSVAQLISNDNVYIFKDFILRQQVTGFTGSIVDDVTFGNTIILENIVDEFNSTNLFDLIDPDTNLEVDVLNLLLNESASFTIGSTLNLTDGLTNVDSVKASGIVLETSSEQNTVRVKLLSGDFSVGIDNDDLILQSSTLSDSVGIGLSALRSLSRDIQINIIDYDYAILKTTDSHGLLLNDSLTIEINPDDTITEKTYYVRKRLFQEVTLRDQRLVASLDDTGIGSLSILGGGFYDTAGTFPANIGNADVNVTITEFLDIDNPDFNIQVPGTGFSVGNRIPVSGGSGTGLIINIDQVGLNGVIQAVSVSSPGIGYENGDLVTPIQEDAEGAVIELVYDTYNSVSSVEIVNKGSGFEEDNIVQLDNLVGSVQQRPAVFRVDHVGVGLIETAIKLTSVNNVSVDDFIKIDNEILKVTAVDEGQRTLTVERGQEGTVVAEHFDGATAEFYNFVYRFNEGDYIPELGTGAFSPIVYSYNSETNLLVLAYDYGINPEATTNVTISTFIRDSSVDDRKDVLISSVSEKIFRLEFSEDDENNFVVNPDLNIQLYYKYKFDTSHPSMLQTYLDFSPSINYNLFTTEKIVGEDEPGTQQPNCFVSLKFGFGPSIASNQYDEFQPLRFSNYYYFIVASGVDTGSARLSIIQDSLTGKKKVNYSTNNKILFKLDTQPQENGSGDIAYVTSAPNARGLIRSISLDNSGSEYFKIPTVTGVEVPESDAAQLVPILNGGQITSLNVINGGSGYIDAEIITVGGDGIPGAFNANIKNGKVINVTTVIPGRNYTILPTFKVVEKSHKIYATSKTIGVAKSVTITNSGSSYSKDTTTIPRYSSSIVVLLSNINEFAFTKNSIVTQKNLSGEILFSARVVETIAKNSNIVKLKDITGSIDTSLELSGSTIVSVLFTDYEAEIKSFFDKKGFFNSEKGLVGSVDSKITDSFYYQDYSYVVRSNTPIDIWRNLIKDVVHPAGFQLFGEVVVEAAVKSVSIPEQQSIIPFTASIDVGALGGFSETSYIQLTEVVNSIGDTNVIRGVGRFNLDEENLAETNLFDIALTPEFDGYIDGDVGKVFGTRTFNIIDAYSGVPVTPFNENAMIISLNGVVQEPGVAFTVDANKITFATAPLGPRVSEGQSLETTDFIGKVFEFVDPVSNEQAFKKIASIFQRNGIWLDAANQIRFNRGFIIEETFGYLTTKYPATLFDTSKCKRDIGLIIDAFEHDLRFGGNEKTVISGNSYYNAANELDFINNELTETRDAYLYVAKLCAAAVRNWDVIFIDDPATPDPAFEVIISANSDLITVPSTFGLVEGMYLSSGEQFPSDTRIIEIIDENNVRVSNNAFADITDGSAFIFEIPSNTIEQLPGTSGEIEFEYNGVLINTDAQLIIDDGTTVSITAAIAKLLQVRFGFSKINKGKFVDAASLVTVNRKLIIDETISYINTTFPTFENPSETKCKRDIGYFIDAVTYHLNYGGNNRIIDFAEKYYLANQLNYITNELTETKAAFQFATDLIKILIDPNNPDYGLYSFQTLSYVIAPDEENPLDLCADVKSALDSYVGAYNFILENGPHLIQREFTNPQRSGEYTDILTYSNYDILDDNELQLSVSIDGVVFQAECAEVVSALYTLHQSLDTILNTGSGTVDISLPDYINGENTIFELYTEDGDILKTVNGEDLLVFIGGVLQRPTAYKILRDEDPLVTDKIEFSEPPKWDVSDAQLNLGESISVENFYAYSIGVYDRRGVDERFIDIRRDLTILDSDGGAITTITDDRYFTVFVNGVQQRNRVDYNIRGNRIVFNDRLTTFTSPDGKATRSTVDIISYQGNSDNNNFRAFAFERGVYTSRATLDVFISEDGGDFYDQIIEWDASSTSYPAYLTNDGNVIGTITSYRRIVDPFPGVQFTLAVDNNPEINQDEPIIFKKDLEEVADLSLNVAVIFDEDETFVGPDLYVFGNMLVEDGVTITVDDTATVVSAELVYDFNLNESGERIFERISPAWMFDRPDVKNKAYRVTEKITSNLLEGDQIKIDGENNYRTVLEVPDIVRSNDFRPFRMNQVFGNVVTTPSLEKPAGNGLVITSVIDPDTGAVTGLDVGQPNTIQLNLLGYPVPELGQGYSPGIYVDFIPVDNNGGGAQARIFVWNGIPVSVELIRGGSGYTQPPIPVITRGYNIKKFERNIQSSILRTANINIETPVTLNSQQITLINPNLLETGLFLPVGLGNPIDEFVINKFIESEVVEDTSQFSLTAIPQEILISGEGFVSDVDVIIPDLPVETLFIKPQESSAIVGATQETSASLLILSEARVGAGDTLITPETLNQIAAIVNIQQNPGDLILFVTSTDQFPDEGSLIVGTEVMTYSSKLPDRFIIDIRGAEGTIEATHIVGEVVKIYLNFINSNAAPTENIETDNIFDQADGAPVDPIPAGPLGVAIDVEYEIESNEPPEVLEPAAVFVNENNVFRAIEKVESVELTSIEQQIIKIARNDQVFNIDFTTSITDVTLFLNSDLQQVSLETASTDVQLQVQTDGNVSEFNVQESSVTIGANTVAVSVPLQTFVSYSALVEKPATPAEEPIGDVLSVGLSSSVENVFTITIETKEENLPLSNVEMPRSEQPPSDLISVVEAINDTTGIVGETFSEIITIVEEESLPEDVSYIFIGETTDLISQVTILPRDIEAILDEPILIKELVKTPDAAGYLGVYPEITTEEEVTSVYDADAHEIITPTEDNVNVDVTSEVERSAGDEFNENINPTQIDTN